MSHVCSSHPPLSTSSLYYPIPWPLAPRQECVCVDACAHLDVECSQSDVVRVAAEKVSVTEVEGVEVPSRRLFCSRLCSAKVSKVTTEVTTWEKNTANVNAALCQKNAGRCQESLNIYLANAGFPAAYADPPSVAASEKSRYNLHWGAILGTKIKCIQNAYSSADTECVQVILNAHV